MNSVTGMANGVPSVGRNEASETVARVPVPQERPERPDKTRLNTDAVVNELTQTRKSEERSAKEEESPQEKASLERAAEEINQALNSFTSLNFQVDRDLDQVVVQVVDRSTGDVVRQIPKAEMVELAKQMHDVKGLLFDVKA